MKIKLHVFIFAQVLYLNVLQSQVASFANWFGNKKGAYTLVHDDYGDVSTVGITQYADSMAFNRGIKFCFGAITSVCDAADWLKAKQLITHGHECINHSHNHYCSQPVPWCPSQVYGSSNFPTELDLSSNLIASNTGVQPRFFINPYDLLNESVNTRLKTLGYIGVRGGSQEVLNTNSFTDFFHLNYFVFTPTTNTLSNLNNAIDLAIASQGYAMREVHGVGDQSWATVPVTTYGAHLDYVKTKILSGDIWNATATEAITYKMQRDAYSPIAVYNTATKAINVNFTQLKPLNLALLKTPLTVNVVANIAGDFNITQGSTVISKVKVGNVFTFNVFPHLGNVKMTFIIGSDGGQPPPPPPPCVANDTLNRELWSNVVLTTYSLAALKADARFIANTPTSVDKVRTFSASDRGDAYGERVSGYIVPPTTGNYTFYVVGDDDVELYLSTDATPATKRKICGFTGFTDLMEFTKYTGQRSVSIALTAGKSYYVELLHIGTEGPTNHYGAYWSTPTVTAITEIAGQYISNKTCPVSSLISAPTLALSAKMVGERVILRWQQRENEDIDYFVLEKQLDDGRYETLNIVSASGAVKGISDYVFADEHLLEGENTYRLSRFYIDGRPPQYSAPLVVNYERLGIYSLSPNPANETVSIDLTDAREKSVDISVYNLLGRQLLTEHIASATGQHILDIGHLMNGQYIVKIQASGARMVMKKLMVMH